MHVYLLILCGASLVSGLCAGFVLGRGPAHRAGRLAAALLAAAAWWTLCEILWNLAPDAETAYLRIRISAAGWCFIAPLVLHLFLEASRVPWPRLWKLLPVLYASSLAFVALTWFTPWVIAGMERKPWGWAYVVGPLYPLFYAQVMSGVLPTVYGLFHAFHSVFTPAERKQQPWIWIGIGVPMVIGSVTDAILPLLGTQVPRLGSASFALLGAVVAFNVSRSGYSFLTPSSFAEEIFDTLSEGVVLVQWDDRIRNANRGMARLSGRERHALKGLRVSELLSWRKGAEDEPIDAELTRRDGERIPVKLTVSELQDRRGGSIGSVLVVRDLREVAELRQRLLLSARLAAVGELAAGVAHEINNPLAFVRANLTQLESRWKQAGAALPRDPDLGEALSEGEDLIAESLEGVERATAIVRGVRGFSHAGGGARVPSDLNQLLEDVLHMAEAELRGRADIVRDYGEIPEVPCAPQELKQVFLNLVLNAGQAIRDGGRIRVQTRTHGDDVAVAIEDDGCGIAPDILERIFDPFFTTKPIGEGTGLGLGIAYQIVDSHRGEIRVDSQPGHGARFEVRLPGKPVTPAGGI